MKKFIYIFAVLCLGLGITSCMPETLINDTDTPRHQIENLKAVTGDEEVTLSWTVPEGWEPTDYQITYNDANSVTQTILTGGISYEKNNENSFYKKSDFFLLYILLLFLLIIFYSNV